MVAAIRDGHEDSWMTGDSSRSGVAEFATEALSPLQRSIGRLDRLLRASDRHWVMATVMSVLAMGVVWVVARLVATAGLAFSGLAGCVATAVVLSVLATLVLSAVVVGPLRARTRHGAPPWEVASLVLSVASLGLFVEAMAAVTAATWRQVGLSVSAWAGLWRAEEFYLYQLVRSVPLLDLPATVGWREPAYAVAHTSAGLQLAFRLIVIAPLLRIAVEGYRLIVERTTQRATVDWIGWNRFDRSFDRIPAPGIDRRKLRTGFPAGVVFGGFVLKAVVVGAVWYLAYAQAYTSGSWLTRHWLQLLHTLHGDVPRLLPWLRPLPQVAVLIASWWVFALLLATMDENKLDTRWRTATPITQTMTAVFCAMLFDSGVLLLLRGIGVPGAAVGRHPVDDALTTLGWHLVAALPGPDIAAILHWTPSLAIAGSPWGWLAMIPKILLLGSVVFIWLPGIKVGTFRQRYAPVLEFWFAVTAALKPTADNAAQDLTTAYQALTRRPEFAALQPAAEQVRAAAAAGSKEQIASAADRFLAAVDAQAPDCAAALRNITRVLNDEDSAVPGV